MPAMTLIKKLLASAQKIFRFDPALATFTPSLAKRATSAGPFATAPIVQSRPGAYVGDVLSFSRGTQVKDYWYANFDPYQGDVSLFWIPEYSSSGAIATLFAYILHAGVVTIAYDYANSRYSFTVGGQTMTVASALTAGTMVTLVFAWDTKNPIDGTNYARVSINDVHTFGISTRPTVAAPNAAIYVGCNTDGTLVNSGEIIGLHISREGVHFDGRYGADLGNGDVVNLKHNSGSGNDITEILGSWGESFNLPTNQTAGALVTGTGEGHSHPHLSSVVKDGWLANGYYGNQWGVAFDGSGDYIGCGNDAGVQNLHDNAFTVETWAKINSSTSYHPLVAKGNPGVGGWELYTDNGSMRARIGTVSGDAMATASGFTDGKFHNFCFTFDDDGDRKVRLYVDGVLVSTSGAAIGAVVSDVPYTLNLGFGFGYYMNGTVGWTRISNVVRYSANFLPSRTPPAPDANTLGQWSMSEGTGVTVTNVGTIGAAANGTITNGTWEPQWYPYGTPIVPVSINDNVSFGSAASLDDLPLTTDFTVELWCNLDLATATRTILSKGHIPGGESGWGLYSISRGTVYLYVDGVSLLNESTTERFGKWNHVCFTYNFATKQFILYVNGVSRNSNIFGGVYDSDAARSVNNNNAYGRAGDLGWVRISNTIRYTAAFTPNDRFTPPATDANTLLLCNSNEGYGTTTTDQSGLGNHGTLSAGTWNNTPSLETDAPGARLFNWGQDFGSDAANEGIQQTYVGLSAGANYVTRALAFAGVDRLAQPRLTIYDETNGAEITHLDGDWSKEIVANGDFAAGDTLWVKGTGWSIAAGVAHCDGSQAAVSNLSQAIANQLVGGLVITKLYKLVYTISGYSAGTLTPKVGSSASGTARSADGTYTEYLRCTTDTTIYFAGDADFIGDIDNISVTFISEYNHPNNLLLSYELPTIARNGTVADCVSVSVIVSNVAASGEIGVHQVEQYTNLLDNPSLTVGAGNPWIPSGWTNDNADAGDLAQETTITHSTGSSLLATSGFVSDYIYQTTGNPIGYLGIGWWANILSGPTVKFGFYNASFHGHIQRNKALPNWTSSVGGYWRHVCGVGRALNTGRQFNILAEAARTQTQYTDDMYIIALDAVSLTVTPASLANSTEGTGIRNDGADTTTMPLKNLKANSGIIQFNYTPRHNAADMLKFGSTSASIFVFSDGINNYLSFEWSAANTLRLRIRSNAASETTATWNATGAIVAGTTYKIKIVYTAGGCKAYIDGVERINNLTPILFNIAGMTVAYFGGSAASVNSDAVFS